MRTDKNINREPESVIAKLTSAVRALGVAGLVSIVGACATPPASEGPAAPLPRELTGTTAPPPGLPASVDLSDRALAAGDDESRETQLFPGSGRFTADPKGPPGPGRDAGGGKVTLNFQNTDVREVVQSVLGDILQENFVIDPGVVGAVSITTGRPIARNDLLTVFEDLLRFYGVALVADGKLYKVVMLDKAVAGNLRPQAGANLSAIGYSVRVVPLAFISATEMEKLLKPFAPPSGILSVDPARNLLMLAGTARDLARMQETIDVFDVNWLAGMSVGIFPVRFADPQTLVGELDKVLGAGSESPVSGLFQFLPIERLESVLVITPQPAYLEQARIWIDRLDSGAGEVLGEQRLYVYQVQNSEAAHLADLLQDVFEVSGGSSSSSTPAARTAPNRQQTSVSSTSKDKKDEKKNDKTTQNRRTTRASADGDKTGAIDREQVRVIADEDNNVLLILASPRDYRIIEETLKRLDVPRRQVLIEATIAEVSLTGNLEYGVQWYFKNSGIKAFGDAYTGTGAVSGNVDSLSIGQTGAAIANGFSYALTDAGGVVSAFLQALARDSKVRILQAPHLMVLDNESGNIRVGNQQPVFTSTTQNLDQTGGVTNNIVTNQIQFKDTGISLDVTPRINAGGLITMELTQEVTDVGQIDTATGQRSFLQRTIESVIAVQSGQTIVLGGLIQDNQTRGKSGVPLLYRLPVIGNLFGSTNDSLSRTELIVLITPRIIRDSDEANKVTEEMRQRLNQAFGIYDSTLPQIRNLTRESSP
ncbi:MAG: type II secretion system secretin GspD [Chromatiales bacterium]|nr:type II secretion system secretin GspD [Chromatiales bacterium]